MTIETKIAKNGAIRFFNAETGKQIKEADAVAYAIENDGIFYTASVHGYDVDNFVTKEFMSPITAYKWICRMARKSTTYADGDARIVVGFHGEIIYTQKMGIDEIKNTELRAYVEEKEAAAEVKAETIETATVEETAVVNSDYELQKECVEAAIKIVASKANRETCTALVPVEFYTKNEVKFVPNVTTEPATYLPAPVKVKTTPGGDKRYYVRENGKARRIGFCDAVWLEEKNIIETCKSLAENTVDEMKDAVACLQLEIVNVICRKTEKSFLFANVDDAINAARKIRDTFADKFVAAAIIGDNEHFSNKTLATFMPDAERFSAAYVEWKNADTTKSDRDIADALSRELYAVTRRADYMNVTLQSGKQIPTCFGNAFVEPDWNRDNGFVFTNGHETFARYDTPEQVKAVADKLKAAVESGATEFAFPTVDELINPPTNPQVEDSLTRAMKIALDCYKGFCYVGNLTAAESELKLYNICRKAMTKLRKE